MTDGVRLQDRREIEELLSGFDAATERHGDALFRMGAVTDVDTVAPGRSFVGQVQDRALLQVAMERDLTGSWEARCSCSAGSMPEESTSPLVPMK